MENPPRAFTAVTFGIFGMLVSLPDGKDYVRWIVNVMVIDEGEGELADARGEGKIMKRIGMFEPLRRS